MVAPIRVNLRLETPGRESGSEEVDRRYLYGRVVLEPNAKSLIDNAWPKAPF
jgi:hypothetical protein